MVETETNAIHLGAFIDQPVATPHQPGLPVPKCRQSRQLPPGGSQELRRFWNTPFSEPLYCGSHGSPNWRPLQLACASRFLSGIITGWLGKRRIPTVSAALLSGGTPTTGRLHELKIYEHIVSMKIWNNQPHCVDSAYG